MEDPATSSTAFVPIANSDDDDDERIYREDVTDRNCRFSWGVAGVAMGLWLFLVLSAWAVAVPISKSADSKYTWILVLGFVCATLTAYFLISAPYLIRTVWYWEYNHQTHQLLLLRLETTTRRLQMYEAGILTYTPPRPPSVPDQQKDL